MLNEHEFYVLYFPWCQHRSHNLTIIIISPYIVWLMLYIYPDESSSITTIEELTRAARSTGFFQVANHGVPIRSLRTIQQYSRRFFDLPFEKKAEVGRLLGKLSGNRERQGDRYFCGYGPGNDSGARNKWWSEFLRVAPRVVGLSRVIDTLLPPIGHGDPSFRCFSLYSLILAPPDFSPSFFFTPKSVSNANIK